MVIREALVFPMRSGKAISPSALPKILQHHQIPAVAHVVLNKVEAAYARSDLFERRRRLMDEWSGYLAGEGQ